MEIRYTLKDFDKGKIISKFNLQQNGSAELFLADTCFRRMDKYTPRDTHTMATNVTIKPGKIIYEQEYAIYQYEGYTKGPVKNYSHQNGHRGKHWDKRMWNAEKDIVAKEVNRYIKANERK